MNCKECIYAVWELTSTGRIKAKVYGQCAKRHELKAMWNHKEIPPCIAVSPAHIVVIWPEYDASHCPWYQEKAK